MPHLQREHHPNAKITSDKAESIRREYMPGKISMKDLGLRHGVSETTISRILNGKTWAVVSPSDTTN